MTFDTLSYARRLKASGFTEQQAETLADATREIVVQDFAANFATKADLAALEERLTAKIDAQGLALTAKIDAQGLALTTKIDAQGLAFTAKIDSQGLRLTVRIGVMLVAVATVMTTIIGLLIRTH